MAETTTTNYGWTKPELQHSPSTWGGFLNQDLDAIDALVFANQQGLAPIGSLMMFAAAAAPANWLLCNGQSLSTAAPYDKLFNVIQYAFGGSGASFNLPNLVQRFPLGAGVNVPGAAGGQFNVNVSIAVANLPTHAHAITDVAHSHSITDVAHTHADTGHAHSITDAQHLHTMGGSFGYGVGGIAPNVLNTGGAPAYTGPSYSGINHTEIGAAAISASGTGLSHTEPSGTNLAWTQAIGAGTPLNVQTIPPWVAINFIIRFK